jgi:hypothetical protein
MLNKICKESKSIRGKIFVRLIHDRSYEVAIPKERKGRLKANVKKK